VATQGSNLQEVYEYETDATTSRSRPESLARQHHARASGERHATPLIDEPSITGLTSNLSIFDHAIKNSNFYDDAIRGKLEEGKSGEALFFELAIGDLAQAADLFRPVYDRSKGVDGWVSLEVSPTLANDTAGTIAEVKQLHTRAGRPNLFIKIPGTRMFTDPISTGDNRAMRSLGVPSFANGPRICNAIRGPEGRARRVGRKIVAPTHFRGIGQGRADGPRDKKCGAGLAGSAQVFELVLRYAAAFFVIFDADFDVGFLVVFAFSFAANSCVTVAEMASTSVRRVD
jgi:hypothetical protein